MIKMAEPLDIALIQIDGIIAGLESNSSIPVQASELRMIKMFIELAKGGQLVPMKC